MVSPKYQIKRSAASNLKARLIWLCILLLVSSAFVFPTYINQGIEWVNAKSNVGLPFLPAAGFNLGLDLQGGAHLVYQAKVDQIPDSDRADAVEGVRDVIERRVRGGLGVAEPLVQTTRVGADYRVIVELPGVTDVNQAIRMIGETPILEFKEQNNAPARELTTEERKEMDKYNAAARKKANEALQTVRLGRVNFADVAARYSEDEDTKHNGGDLGFIDASIYPEFYNWTKTHKNGEVGKDLVQSANGLNVVKRLGSRNVPATESSATTTEFQVARILVKTKTAADIVPPADDWKSTGLSGKQLKRAEVTQDYRTGQVQVSLNFDDEGARMFADITSRNVGNPVAIFLDGQPISVPTVNEAIMTGSAVISGNFDLREARLLTQRLNSGALPVPVELISQQKVDATLGADSLAKSLKAGIAGFIAVALFAILYYRLPGIVAVVALGFYSILSMAIFRIIGVTLTLSGIAGFILSVGMAVDANVLVFERLKEELRWGKSLRLACEEAFARAWPSIRDSNITTLISCGILIWFGTGFVQGFAVTLAIGVLVSMFTAITVTRTLLRAVNRTYKKDQANIMFLGHRKENVLKNS